MTVNRTQLLATFVETSTVLENLTATLTEAQLNYRSAPEEWSIREILAHLVDDEMFVMRVRLERAVKETNPEVADNDEKAWYRQRNTTRDEVAELLHDFTVQRAASVNILTFLRESDWAKFLLIFLMGRLQ